MKVYKVQAPDGSIIKIEGPENATDDQLIQAAQAAYKPAKAPQPQPTYDPTEGMSTFEKFAAGTGKAIVDLGRGVAQYLPKSIGGLSNEEILESRNRDKALMATTAGTLGNIAGNIGLVAPSVFIPGAATIPGAALTGAAYGALQPSAGVEESLKNIALGAASSAAIPAALRTGRVAKAAVEPFYEGGRQKIIGQALRKVAGNQADDALKSLKNASEIIPGSAPTAAEAANNAGIAAMQRTATQVDPVAMNQLAMREALQKQARLDALSNVTPDIVQAKALRSETAGALYDKARTAGFDPEVASKLQPKIQELMTRVPDDLISQAQQLAKVSGENITDMGSVQGAHYLKKAIDSKISQAARAGDNETVRAYKGLQNQYLEVLDDLSPSYKSGREAFANLSKEVNQAEILNAIAQRGAKATTGDLTPEAFSRAIQDKTAKGVIGRDVKMQDALTPEQFQTLQNIKADLLRSEFAKTAGRGVGSDTVQKLAFSNLMDASGIPSAMSNVAPMGILGNVSQRLGQVAYKDANEKMTQQLAQALLDPAITAKLMEGAKTSPQLRQLALALRRGGVAIGAAAPGVVQANQE